MAPVFKLLNPLSGFSNYQGGLNMSPVPGFISSGSQNSEVRKSEACRE